MKKVSPMFDKARMFQMAGVVALGTTLGATAVQAGPEHTINFNGHALNCATLQGFNDGHPNPELRYDLTCGFIEEVEQYIQGPKLKCNPDVEGYKFEALQPGARHMAVGHSQPGIYGYTETWVAKINALASGKKTSEELQRTHVDTGEVRDLYLSYLAIQGIKSDIEKGASLSAAIDHITSQFSERSVRLPGTQGPAAQMIREFLSKNPVVDGFLQCKEKFPRSTWPTYE